MNKSRGQIVEYIVRKNGYSITDLAKGLNVNRRTIYNYFQNQYLKYNVIYNIGIIIRYDFSKDFPDLFSEQETGIKDFNIRQTLVNSEIGNNGFWKEKYISLLEEYNELLKKVNHHTEDDLINK